jgi:hypothetical protein
MKSCTKCGILAAQIRPQAIAKWKGAVLCPTCLAAAKEMATVQK